MSRTRREFLVSGSKAVTVGVGVTAGTATVAAQSYNKPADLTREFDEDWLLKYQPLLATRTAETRSDLQALYGYKVTSSEYEYDVAAYWTRYTMQTGLTIPFTDFAIRADSHRGDHEPIYVFVDKDTGEVATVVYSGYHHFASEVSGDAAPLSTSIHSDEQTHISLEVFEEYHHYRQASSASAGAFFELRDFTAARNEWLARGTFESTALQTVNNPAVMLERDTWWDRSTLDYQFAKIWLLAGLRGADGRDDLRSE